VAESLSKGDKEQEAGPKRSNHDSQILRLKKGKVDENVGRCDRGRMLTQGKDSTGRSTCAERPGDRRAKKKKKRRRRVRSGQG